MQWYFYNADKNKTVVAGCFLAQNNGITVEWQYITTVKTFITWALKNWRFFPI
jgi:hypothetical protein